jgi:hypothetical protein
MTVRRRTFFEGCQVTSSKWVLAGVVWRKYYPAPNAAKRLHDDTVRNLCCTKIP